jgi:hypothetical protein
VIAGIVAGCGSYAVQEGDGVSGPTPTPSATPTATPPPAALPTASPPKFPSTNFQGVVQPFLSNPAILSGANATAGAGCAGSAACHLGPNPASGLIMNTKAIATMTAVEESDNALNLGCGGNNLTSFQPANGPLLTYFCTGSNAVASNSTHVPARVPVSVLSVAICQGLYAWVSSGGATSLGTAQTAIMPPCPNLTIP